MIVGFRTRPPCRSSPIELSELIDVILKRVQVAMQRLQLGQDPIHGIVRPFTVGDDHQVVFGDDAIGQPDLVEQQLQPGLEPNAVEIELNGVLRLDILPAECRQVEHHLRLERLLQMCADLEKRRRPRETESDRASKATSQRYALFGALPAAPSGAAGPPPWSLLSDPRPAVLRLAGKGANRRSAPRERAANDSESCSGPLDSSR